MFVEFIFVGRFKDQWQVSEGWYCIFLVKGLVKQYVVSGVGQLFFFMDYVGDFYMVVVYNIGQVVSGYVVGFEQDFIVQFIILELYFILDIILDCDDFVGRYFQVDGIRSISGQEFFYFIGSECFIIVYVVVCGRIVVEVVVAGCFFGFVVGVQFFWCVKCVIGFVVVDEYLSVFLIYGFMI